MSLAGEYDIQKILHILPHRYPFLLIDRILEVEAGKRAVGIKNVTINEHFFVGHFPNFPVMPGVLIVEAMAQVGAFLTLQQPEWSGKIVFFAGIDGFRFRRPVVPGDQLRIEIEALWTKKSLGKMKAMATVDGQPAAEGELMFSLADGAMGGADIHPTATVHPQAEIGKGARIGPYAFIGAAVVVGDGCVIDAHAVIKSGTRIGKENQIGEGAVVGTKPQDLKYRGEKSGVEIGDRNIIREFVTIHAASGEGKVTRIGNRNFLMAYSHVGHNVILGDENVLTNQATLGGHCQLEDQIILGGLCAVHQFVRIGRLAIIGGVSRVIQDIPPFLMVVGNPVTVRSLNTIGLERRGVPAEAQAELKQAFRHLYRSGLNFSQALQKIKKELHTSEVKHLVTFLEAPSERGVLKKADSAENEEPLEE